MNVSPKFEVKITAALLGAMLSTLSGCSNSTDDSSSNLQNDPGQVTGAPESPVTTGSPAGEMSVPGTETSAGAQGIGDSPVSSDDTSGPDAPVTDPDDSTDPGSSDNPDGMTDMGEPTASSGEADPELPARAIARLNALFPVANGDAVERAVAVLEQLGSRDEIGLPALRTYFVEELFGSVTEYACPDGGTFAVGVRSVSQAGNVYSTIATDCTLGQSTIDGVFVDADTFGRSSDLPFQRDIAVSGYRLEDAARGTTTTFDEGSLRLSGNSADGTRRVTGLDWSVRNLSASEATGSYVAASQQSSTTGTVGQASRFIVSINGFIASSGEVAQVETITPFERDEGNVSYDRGSLRVVSEGRVDVLEADSGDPETFLYTVGDGGATTTYSVDWSAVYDFASPDLASGE